MSAQLKLILRRLKNPSVVISIGSQIVSILLLFNIDLDRNLVVTAITGICTVLTLLGIMSNPDTEKNGYGDDIEFCENCQQETRHVRVGDSMVCTHCGKALEQPTAQGR